GSLGWAVRDREAVAAQVRQERALRKERLEERIGQALDETQAEYERDNLPEARARIGRIDTLLAGDSDVSQALRPRRDQCGRELGIVSRLEDLALLPYEPSVLLETDAAYAGAFLDIGIDVDGLPAEDAGRRIRTHFTWKRLAEALDEWANLRHDIAWHVKHI